MAQMTTIKAAARPGIGKGAARAVRREGNIPAVIYGDKKDAEQISIVSHDLDILLLRGRFLKSVFELDIDGRKLKVVPRDVQVDPIKDLPLHVDFQRIGVDNRVRISVPVKFTNEALSPGLKRGGVLNIVRREVEVWCPADKIPETFEFNLDGLEIGRSIHISATRLPDGVKPVIADRDFTVATIVGKKAEEEVKPETVADPSAAAAVGAVPAVAGDAKAAAAPAAGGKPAPAAAGKPAPAAAKAPAGKK